MKRIIPLVLVVALMTVHSRSQAQAMGSEYRTAVGFKFFPAGIDIKHFLQSDRALEGVLYFWDHGFRVTGLYEFHGDINGAPGLKWYVGPGAHIGAYNEGWYHDHHYYDDGAASFGIDGVLGLDYKINSAPIDLSIDINPFIEMLHHPYVDVWGGLGVRFAF